MCPKSFRKFIEESEAKASSPHLDALGAEMGIDARDLEKEPMVGSFFSIGDEIKNIGMYRVVRFKRDDSGRITHAVVERMDDRAIKNRTYRDAEGGMVQTSGGDSSEKMLVPIEDLDKLMSQSLQPPPAGAM
jgi:hypothetical protein